MDAVNRAIELDPSRKLYRLNRCEILPEDSSQSQQAIEELDAVCREDPDNFVAFRIRGELYMRQRDGAAAAIGDFTRMIEILEAQPVPSGSFRRSHVGTISFGYELRSEAHEKTGDRIAADRDLARAGEIGVRDLDRWMKDDSNARFAAQSRTFAQPW